MDLLPTVLDLLGRQAPAPVQGVSLRGSLAGRSGPEGSRPIYCESLDPAVFDCSPLQGMESAAPRVSHSVVDPEAVKRLQSLGYVGGGATLPSSGFDPTREDPKDFLPLYNRLFRAQGLVAAHHNAEARTELLALVALRPKLIGAHRLLGDIAQREHRTAEAKEHLAKILSILDESKDPLQQGPVNFERMNCFYGLGEALLAEGKLAEAVSAFQNALRIEPDLTEAHINLGIARAQLGQLAEAIGQFEEALQRYAELLRGQPDRLDALNGSAWIRATYPAARFRDGTAAVRLAERACQLSERQGPWFLDTLAAAYAEAGRFPEAVATARAAAGLASAQHATNLTAQIEQRAALYQAGQPYREPTPVPLEPK